MDTPYKSPLARRPGMLLVILIVAGAPFVASRYLDFKAFSLDDMIALFAGWMMLSLGLVIAASAITPGPVSRRQSVLSALSMISCGVTLMIPPLAPEALDARVFFGLLVLVIALGYLANWRVMKGWDEMHRHMVAEAAVAGFYVFSTGILLYAGAEALGLRSPIGLWALVALLTLLQVVISSWVGLRRNAPLPEE